MGPGKFQGCGRGVFGLKSWAPLRQPGTSVRNQVAGDSARNEAAEHEEVIYKRQEQSSLETKKRILAKYSYTANPSSPLGQELSVKQGQKLFYLSSHPENEQWWSVQADDGSVGYVPASYMMLLKDEKPGLPWLQNQEEETTATNNVFGAPSQHVYKPYKSSYTHPDLPKTEGKNSKEYYCEVCDKQLNGPRPYSSHMVSKAHKEMVEYVNS